MKKIPFWVAVIIIVIAAFFLVLIVSSLVSEPDGTAKPPTPINGGGQQSPQPPADKQIFSYVGEIQSLSANSFALKALATKNQIDKDVLVTVKLSPETQYTILSVPQTLPQNLDQTALNELFKTQTISLADLKVGDEVTAVSQTDVAGKTEMEATRVQKVNVK